MHPRLYLVTPPTFELDSFATELEAALSAGDVACLQIRLKTADGISAADIDVLTATEKLIPIAHAHDVAVLINDRPDLAQQSGADGVHLGQEDTPYADARALLGAEAIIGVTCHDSRHLAMVAGEAGADYVAFGAFYPTQTKQPKATAAPALLHWWQTNMSPPCVAIGGITPDNAQPLIEAGADFIAVSNGVWHYSSGAAKAVKTFNELFGQQKA